MTVQSNIFSKLTKNVCLRIFKSDICTLCRYDDQNCRWEQRNTGDKSIDYVVRPFIFGARSCLGYCELCVRKRGGRRENSIVAQIGLTRINLEK